MKTRARPVLASLLASLLVACGEAKAPEPAPAAGASGGRPAAAPADEHPAWFVGRWVFDREGSERRLDALGVAKDAKPGDEGMTRTLLERWDEAGLEFLIGASGDLSQSSKTRPAPDTRYRWRAVGADEIEFGPKPGSDLAKQGFRPQRLRRVGDGLESYNARLPIRTQGGEFRYLYRRAPS